MTMGSVRTFHVNEVKLFIGNREQAEQLSQTDADQHYIASVRAYVGDPAKRTTCEFEVEFCDNSIIWLSWSKDLFDTVPYEDFCRINKELFPLLFTVEASKSQISMVRSQNITLVSPGVTVYLLLRNICPYWYESLDEDILTDKYHIQYAVALQYTRWTKPNARKHIAAETPVFNYQLTSLDNYFVTFYGSTQQLSTSMVILDDAFFALHPHLIPHLDVLQRLSRKP